MPFGLAATASVPLSSSPFLSLPRARECCLRNIFPNNCGRRRRAYICCWLERFDGLSIGLGTTSNLLTLSLITTWLHPLQLFSLSSDWGFVWARFTVATPFPLTMLSLFFYASKQHWNLRNHGRLCFPFYGSDASGGGGGGGRRPPPSSPKPPPLLLLMAV